MTKNPKQALAEEMLRAKNASKWNGKSDLLYLKKGQILYFQGSSPQGIFMIEKGKMKISQNTSNGKEFLTHIATTNEILGYNSLFSHSRHNNSAIALEDSILSFINKNDFIELLRMQQDIFEQFMSQLCNQTGELEKKAARIAYKPVRGRLAEALVQLDKKINHNASPNHVLVISRKDLASLIGTVKETAIRLLSEFRDEKLIETHGSTITILDLAKLRKISEMYD